MKINRDEKPLFIEGNVFKTIVPVGKTINEETTKGITEGIKGNRIDGAIDGTNDAANDAVNDAVNDAINDAVNDAINDAVNDAVKRGLIDAVSDAVNDALIDAVKAIIANNNGVPINEVMNKTGKSNATVKRYLQILKTIDFIEFKGAAKTGKYYMTRTALHKIQKKK
ncbi:MAG TPA: hypothetical protein PKN48_14040 [Bacteroidales bacterium]|nr:hypothetical protein [Bacteroidales bacterium]